MIDTKAIRNKILDLAIRGKLTEQLSEDGTAEELYKQIQAEKQALIKSGKIKKEKPLPKIAEDEIPFDIPDNWKWVRFGALLRVLNGVSYEKSDVTTNGLRILRGGNIQDMRIIIDDSDVFLPLLYKDEEKIIHKGDVVIVASTGSESVIGKPGYVEEGDNSIMIGAFLRICRPFSIDLSQFIRLLFMSEYYRQYIRYKAKGTNINNVKETYITHFMVPLPPLAEQKRLVEKIEQAFSVLDAIDELQAKYADNLTVLKSKLIDRAIQGKLTEQLPEDGTAEELYKQIQAEKQALIKSGKIKKEKPLPEITDDEIPFEIPENWKWVRLSSICYCIFAGGDKPEDFVKEKDEEHQIPVVANGVSNEGIMGYTALATAPSNTLTVAGRGTIGFPCYRDYEYCPVVRLIVIDQSNYIELQYLYYIFLGLPADSVGSSIPQLTVPMVMPKLIPLPPLAEQKRIVERLDKLLAACDELK